jgi:hypothetical protein
MPRLLRLVAACLLVFSCHFAFAQRDLGTVTGTVTDPQGAAVPNAKVIITEQATGVASEVTTNNDGQYSRPALPIGTYTVTVEAAGFQKAQQKEIVVQPGTPVSVNISLQVGSASQTVEVTAEAPLLQTESPAIGENLNSTQVSELPLGGQRTFTFLARLSPGVVPAEPGARDALGGGFSANGVRSTGENNFLLNGIDNNVNVIDFINQTSFVIGPSVEAIGNMQVITNGASAEYGRAAGGVLDVSLKSGTNDLHGVLFELLQNTDLNANRWENNVSGTPRSAFHQNQFGVAAGGPIIKNRLFLFGDYQGTRISTAGGLIPNLGISQFYTIPTPAQRTGDFSQELGPQIGTDALGRPILQNEIYDPRTTRMAPDGSLVRDPFPNNMIPPGSQDPVAMKLMSLFPNVNQPSGIVPGRQPQNDYFVSTPGSWNTDQGDGRVDYHLNDKNSIFGTISWSDAYKQTAAPFPGPLDGQGFSGVSEVDLGRDAMISWTHIFSPALVNEARVGFSRLVTSRTQANAETDEFKAVGIGGYDPTTTLNGGLPQFDLGNYSQIGANNWLPTKEYNNEWDLIENLSLIKGTHSFKFGGEFRSIHFPFFQVPFPHGELAFSRTETAYPSNNKDAGGISGTYSADTGDELASFLLGAIDFGQISTTNFISSTKQAYATYVQDTWKVTPKLTLNLGARYELFSPIGEQFGRQSNFVVQDQTLYIPRGPNQNAPLPPNFNTPATVNGFMYPALFPNVKVSRGQVGPYLIPWDKTDIGPRLGFAYNATPKTVIRGFYGVFYGGEENQGGYPNRGESAPFNESPQLGRPAGVGTFDPNPNFAGGAPTGGLTAGFPTNVFTTFPVTSLQFRSLTTDYRNPMVQEWNISIQRELPGQMAIELGYLGNHQSHQLLLPDTNPCPNIFTTNSSINCNDFRLVPYVGGTSGTETFGFGNYNALTAYLQKRYSGGLQFTAAYTYGHALANTGTTLSGSQGYGPWDPTNYNSAYASSAWDIRHNFTSSFTYEIPFGRGKQYGANLNTVVQTVAGNWQLNGILSLRTGVPYTLYASGCQVVSDGAHCAPEFIGSSDYNAAPPGGRTPNKWFNTANFGPPAPLTLGDVGLQSNTGPPNRTLDFSIFKDFAFTERWRLEFRGEAFNIANTPQFNPPDSGLQDANFGRITSTMTGTERHVQFSLRLMF